MTEALPVDTHMALWLDSGHERLRPSTRLLIDAYWQNGGSVLLSAVSAWEIGLLVDTGRILPRSCRGGVGRAVCRAARR